MNRNTGRMTSELTSRKNRPLRIAVFVESFYPYTSGVARRFQEVIERLARQGHRICILTGDQRSQKWQQNHPEINSKVQYAILPSQVFSSRTKNDIALVLPYPGPIFRALFKFKPDVIHVAEHSPGACMTAVIAKHSMGIRVVWSVHSDIDFYINSSLASCAVPGVRVLSLTAFQWFRAILLRYCSDSVATVSRYYARTMAQQCDRWYMPQRVPISIWHTGVDCDTFNPQRQNQQMRRRMMGNSPDGDAEGLKLLVTVGRISPEKNIEFIMRVVQVVPAVFLCVVGEGPLRHQMEKTYSTTRINFIGQLKGVELAEAYASADYFICASKSETFGQVYLEALACGTPVLASRAPQLDEIMIEGVHGFLWEPDNFDEAVGLLKNIEMRESCTSAARNAALAHTWDKAACDIVAIYVANGAISSSCQRKSKEDETRSSICTTPLMRPLCVLLERLNSCLVAGLWLTIMMIATAVMGSIGYFFASMPDVQTCEPTDVLNDETSMASRLSRHHKFCSSDQRSVKAISDANMITYQSTDMSARGFQPIRDQFCMWLSYYCSHGNIRLLKCMSSLMVNEARTTTSSSVGRSTAVKVC